MPLITFLSDFGLQEHYVAVVKARIMHALPQKPILDISHEVNMGNIVQSAYLLKSVYPYCPEGSVHIVAVGTTFPEKHLLVTYQNQYFIGPDNGLFSLCFNDDEKATYYDLVVSSKDSFPARDLYTQTAIQLFNEGMPDLKENKNWSKKIGRQPVYQQSMIRGHIIYVERHGNLITNISKSYFLNKTEDKKFTVRFEYEKIRKISDTYQDVDYGDCLVFFNSNNLMEIAINHGNAAELLGMKYDSPVNVLVSE